MSKKDKQIWVKLIKSNMVVEHTCPTGGDPSLAGLVLELRPALAEGELQTSLDYRRRTHVEAIGEV